MTLQKTPGSSHTKVKKGAKAQRKDFENVLHDLSEEKQQITTIPSSHQLMFLVTGFLTSIVPIVLYLSPVYLLSLSGLGPKGMISASVFDGKVLEKMNWIYFLVASIAAGIVLVSAQRSLALKTRHSLFISREPIPAPEGASAADISNALKVLNATESSAYAIFVVNTIYVAMFLLSAGYILPAYELSEHYNYLMAAVISSLVVFPVSTILL
mmetsp:Transcript_13307/g.18255  ORF Transcript_13307/g.18255 Transcript_13307/m.18255 type:complete len:212 (+) Transcript_13307:19-654(+)|eukprot:CAMPEP_0201100312 /NCGR_PEP_ID=MMETSP0812-20130820/9195_1 /ASSEMBLY_ACC=CAM_ASM_000668 /TAXON_ID=98059 /ORGANISM="Dinobryon sp., Strain UTEXLB2267" /LENGTH=211 /DNA_ID=CAMNT_0047356607 /DNA_START=19 /DNA_END=654 /DNA_ORIENTATION=-